MSQTPDRDYVLGTNDAEIARLGLQHEVWRATVLDCWRHAGLGAGHRVLDVGAGPGFATLDLARTVGPQGAVIGLERSARFVASARARCTMPGIAPVELHELDLMSASWPVRECDFTWCRWVASFVNSPEILVGKIASALRPGGRAIFHEYADYATWRFVPPRHRHSEFVREVMASWRASGGEPDVAPALLPLLAQHGLKVAATRPHLFTIRSTDPMWAWPTAFIDTNLDRLAELGRVQRNWAAEVRREYQSASADPTAVMLTPLVLEIIAARA